ncbi:MAG: Cof-type HAD-IIB family hydrolase [Clostridia bacterium]
MSGRKPMRYRALALDLDGTLTNTQKTVTPRTREALFLAASRGVTVILASGRPVEGMRKMAELVDLSRLDGYVLACNGASILRYRDGQMVFCADIPIETIAALQPLSARFGVALLGYAGDCVVTNDAANRYAQKEAYNNGLALEEQADLARAIARPIPKLMLVGEPERLARAAECAKALFSGQLNVFLSESYFLEITPLGIDKAAGLRRLIDQLGIPREELIAVGDGLNDIPMLAFAGLGVAMQNAYPETKAAADAHTLSNDQDGVAEVVRRYILEAI